ncbi:MAG: EAL domain-containing protein [Methylococcales bacterium]|nr:EAL domain-containing protein [Methylococcales bacterium]
MTSSESHLLSLKNISILCVEDIEEARHFLSVYLKRNGATVFEAENGKQGLELFTEHQPDIIISDIRMPSMNGIEMCRSIRRINSDVPIIFLSAYKDTEHLQDAIELSATQYIIKPIDSEKLTAALIGAQHKIFAKRQLAQTLDKMQASINQYRSEEHQLHNYVSQILGTDDQHITANIINQPKETISGDFYCLEQSSNVLYAMLADGMGHGLSAVLPALNIPRTFHKLAAHGYSLCRIADELNQIIYEHHLHGHFVATTLVKLDTERQLIEVLNCGNPDVLMTDLTGSLLQSFPSNHLPWGVVGGDDFLPELQVYQCNAGARLYLCSDGLTETLEKHKSTPNSVNILSELICSQHNEALLDKINTLLQEIPESLRHDDITLLELNYLPTTQLQNQSLNILDSVQFPENNDGQSELHTPLKWLSVLYIEEDPDALEYLSKYLTRRVGILYSADNAEEALQLFKKYRPQLVISDIDIPAMSGFQLVESIRKIDHDVPIIINSAPATWEHHDEIIEVMLELEITKFLPKPLNAERMLDAIRECIKQYEYANNLKLSASVFMSSSLAATITDNQRNFIAVNPAFTKITGYTQAEVMGSNPRILSSGKHDNQFYEQMWGSLNGTGQWSGEIWNQRKGGELYLEWININVIKDDAGEITHYASVFSDITQRDAAEEKMRHLAHHDVLTNLPNRILMQDRLNQAILNAKRKNSQFAVIYLDIDHFKNINDTLGHGVGDKLIIAVSESLQTALRESDTVSRLGGDEFAIILPDVDSTEMTHTLITKIFNAASRTYHINEKELYVTASMGICLFPNDGDTVDMLIKRADSAMYLAKKKGRNNFQFFDDSLETQAERYMAIQQGLHKALEHNEFNVQYQPKYDIEKQIIVGAEALLRWNSLQLGSVSPAEFIPIAEETGLIAQIGNWVIEEVCKTMASWKANGIKLVPISVNISPIQFHRGDLQQKLLQEITTHGVDPKLMQVELTEGVVMDGEDKTIKLLEELKELGISISIDDFGTGFSCLSYLNKLPVDELKIDRSFITGITDEANLNDTRLTTIPLAIIGLAKNFNLKLVAEGVETDLQRDFLLQNGCTTIQGYWFSKPVSSTDMKELLR